jgi:hypothetical protein
MTVNPLSELVSCYQLWTLLSYIYYILIIVFFSHISFSLKYDIVPIVVLLVIMCIQKQALSNTIKNSVLPSACSREDESQISVSSAHHANSWPRARPDAYDPLSISGGSQSLPSSAALSYSL